MIGVCAVRNTHDRWRIQFVPLRRIQNHARSAPVAKNALPKRKKKAARAQVRNQADRSGMKLESRDLPRSFMIDKIEINVSKKKKVVTWTEFAIGLTRWFGEGCLSPKLPWPWALRMRVLKQHCRRHFSEHRRPHARQSLSGGSKWQLLSSSSQRPKCETNWTKIPPKTELEAN